FTEKAAFQVRAAPKHAAVRGVGSIEPEGERGAVAKKEVDLAPLHRETRGVSIGIGTYLCLGEECPEIGLMRGPGDNSDLFSFKCFRTYIFERAVAASHETRRRTVIGIAEIDTRAHFRRRGDRSDDGVAVVAVEGSD